MSRATFYGLIAACFAIAGFWFPWCRISASFFCGVAVEIGYRTRGAGE